ncbi:O-antigen polysaccharide polymerase Wzy [Paenibacillus chitinolyticus]|uniref:O-antigen polysaccharide polymerase Wzy n=1 Tax=Paenibacillus chitinolyticus TaxID=79263 RepID=UPI0000E5F1BD|nr:O-antigen polysaccharide polymerase Wzy [Paenibacillus chitinolyticus]MEC0247482.1 O-antigen polysaccharide polymerase Wzy [Paenibacillus chitinolyticus]
MSERLLRPLGISWKKALMILLVIISVSICSIFLSTHILLTQITVIGLVNIAFIRVYLKLNPALDAFTSATVLFSFFFLIYGIALPMDTLFQNTNLIQSEEVIGTLTVYLAANLCFVAGALASQFLKVRRNEKLVLARAVNLPKIQAASIVLLLIGLALMVFDQFRLGGFDVIGVENRMNNFVAQRQSTSLAIPWKIMITAGFFGWSISICSKKQLYILYFSLITVCLFYFFGLGSRSLILMTILPTFAWLVNQRKIKLTNTRKIVLVGIVLAMMSPIFNNVRQSLIENKTMETSKQSWSFSEGETGTAFEIANDILSTSIYPNADPSYLTAVLYFLPSSIYKFFIGHEKPLNMGDWYVSYFHPYLYQHGGGMGFSPIAQAWMNGEWWGIIGVFIILGFILCRLDRTLHIHYLVLPFTIWFQRSSFHSVMTDFIFILIFYSLIRFVGTRNQISKNRNIELYRS